MTRTYMTKSLLTVQKAKKVLDIMKSDYTITKNDNGTYNVTFTCSEEAKRYIDAAFSSSYIR